MEKYKRHCLFMSLVKKMEKIQDELIQLTDLQNLEEDKSRSVVYIVHQKEERRRGKKRQGNVRERKQKAE